MENKEKVTIKLIDVKDQFKPILSHIEELQEATGEIAKVLNFPEEERRIEKTLLAGEAPSDLNPKAKLKEPNITLAEELIYQKARIENELEVLEQIITEIKKHIF